MKKLLAMLCMLTCVFGLTACGSETELSATQLANAENAKVIATDFVIPYMTSFFDDAIATEYQQYNVHELKAMAEDEFNYALYVWTKNYGLNYNFSRIEVEGNAILNGIASYNGTYASLGDVDLSNGLTATYKVTGDEIIVSVPVTGTVTDKNGKVRTATAEVIFSNDLFLTIESCALNLNQSKSELMGKAGADTLMGMGTVFIVLILICFLIVGLGVVAKLIEGTGKKNKKEELQAIKADAVDNTIAQIIEKEESADDLELVAVIAAAIAAYEGAAGTDGFVVRSIRKRR